MRSCVWCLLVLGAASAAAQIELPPELSGLEFVIDNEAEAVQTVRKFDRLQRGLIDWDGQLAIRHRTEGDPFLADGDLARAQHRQDLIRQAYEIVLNRYPKNAAALNYYGEFLYDELHQEEKAVSLWHLAVRLDPELASGHNNLALFYAHQGRYNRCFEYLDRTLELEPRNPDYLYNAAQLYLVHFNHLLHRFNGKTGGVYKKAMEFSKKARDLAPDEYEFAEDYAANFYAGEGMGVEIDWRKAAEAWAQARTLAPSNEKLFYCWLNEGRTLQRAGDSKNAEAALRQALQLRPDSEAAANLLSKLGRELESEAEE